VSAADTTGHLALGTYDIADEPPASALANGWTLTSVVCNGVLEPFAEGTVKITLTPHQPKVHCVDTDAFSAAPVSPPPPPPTSGSSAHAGYELSDLIVTKRASQKVVRRGQIVSYRISVKNLGPMPPTGVAFADLPHRQATVASIHNLAGACRAGRPIICRLGAIDPGATITITIRLAVITTDSNLVNRAVVGSATPERTLANNSDQATVRVLRALPPPPRPRMSGRADWIDSVCASRVIRCRCWPWRPWRRGTLVRSRAGAS
jgi:uncharacterized repeat protein (TIGR01451 family)